MVGIIVIFFLVPFFLGAIHQYFQLKKTRYYNQAMEDSGIDEIELATREVYNQMHESLNRFNYEFLKREFNDVMIYDISNQLTRRSGHFKELNFKNGEKYIGEVVNGVMDGYGVYYDRQGTKIEGTWKNGLKDGIMIFSNSEVCSKKTYTMGVMNGKAYIKDINNYEVFSTVMNEKIMSTYVKDSRGNITKI